MSSFLETILADTRDRVERQKSLGYSGRLTGIARELAVSREPYRLRRALSRTDAVNVIAEFKRASPSKGPINPNADIAMAAKRCEAGDAAAMSVLTEESHFDGSLDDLRRARASTDLPLLRKDFTVDEYQIYEAAAAGADAVLLIAAALPDEEISRFLAIACDDLKIDAIVEVHTEGEFHRAVGTGAAIIGVNNRDLKTFKVDLDISRRLIEMKPESSLMISESGISEASELRELRQLGFDGFLVGEALMRSQDPVEVLKSWTRLS